METVVSQSGNGAHVFVPKEWIGMIVNVILWEN
jgi:putative transposon-encoded protein